MLMIEEKIPSFTASAVINNTIQTITPAQLNVPKVFIFYPLNFTFVCPTELHAFQEAKSLFDTYNALLYGISVDSVYSHLAWLELEREKGGIKGIEFPLIGDITKSITRQFGVLNESTGIAYRALFVVDPTNIIRAIHLTDNSLGRSVTEALRMVEATLFSQQTGKACPANWAPQGKALYPTKPGVKEYFSTQ
jgi:peroxiredoxin (alkyl hydroperoxide reductase subunit C)